MEVPHNCVILVNSLQQLARLSFAFHHVGKDFVDMSWSTGLEVVPVFGAHLQYMSFTFNVDSLPTTAQPSPM